MNNDFKKDQIYIPESILRISTTVSFRGSGLFFGPVTKVGEGMATDAGRPSHGGRWAVPFGDLQWFAFLA